MTAPKPFTLKPKHWWTYLNPFWYRQKRITEEVMAYYWEKEGLQKKFEEKIRRHYLYGEPL